jgi:hypothetical protein
MEPSIALVTRLFCRRPPGYPLFDGCRFVVVVVFDQENIVKESKQSITKGTKELETNWKVGIILVSLFLPLLLSRNAEGSLGQSLACLIISEILSRTYGAKDRH